MKTASQTLIDFLNSSQQMTVVDLYTFSILRHSYPDGGSLTAYYNDYRYCTWDQAITVGGLTYSATGVLLERDRVRTMIGVEVDTLNIRAFASGSMNVEGVPFLQACAQGTLDGAIVKLERAFMDGTTIKGNVVVFSGRVAQVNTSRSAAEITVNSDLELLNIKMPRNLYQTSCQHTLYDAGCTASRATYTKSATINTTGGMPTTTRFSLAGTSMPASGYYDLGAVIFTSGDLDGTMSTIKSWDGTTVTLVNPLPSVPVISGTVKIYPGCDKTQTTCAGRFNNLPNYRGFPFIPVPETSA